MLKRMIMNELLTAYTKGTVEASQFLLNSIKYHLTKSLYSVTELQNIPHINITTMFEWLNSIPEFKSGVILNPNSGVRDCKLMPGVYLKILGKDTVMLLINRIDTSVNTSKRYRDVYGTLYFIGLRHEMFYNKMFDRLRKNQKSFSNNSYDRVYSVYAANGSGGFGVISKNKRTFETIFSNQKKSVMDTMDKWKSLADVYTEYELVHKIGILLHGRPGTGKTSFAKAIANYCSRDIHIVDLGLPLDTIRKTISGYSNVVLLFEDIDCFVKDREKALSKEDGEKLNFLLGLLDGIYSNNDCIYIATTNYIERIDEAFKRPGRFNKIVEITDIDKKYAIEMCEHYKVDKSFLDKFTFPINPSLLQNELLEERFVSLGAKDLNMDVKKMLSECASLNPQDGAMANQPMPPSPYLGLNPQDGVMANKPMHPSPYLGSY